jgi:hypothetical protein
MNCNRASIEPSDFDQNPSEVQLAQRHRGAQGPTSYVPSSAFWEFNSTAGRRLIHSHLLKKLPPQFEDRLGTTAIHIHFDRKTETGFVTDSTGQTVPSVILLWFAWADFYPDTLVFASNKD